MSAEQRKTIRKQLTRLFAEHNCAHDFLRQYKNGEHSARININDACEINIVNEFDVLEQLFDLVPFLAEYNPPINRITLLEQRITSLERRLDYILEYGRDISN